MKNSTKNFGFSLIELIVYFFLITLTITLLFNWAVALQFNLNRQATTTNKNIQIHTALDLLARDIYNAPAQTHLYKKTSPNQLIWQQGDSDLGWICEGTTLYRIEGNYNTALSTWSAKVQSVVCKYITDVNFEIIELQQGAVNYIIATNATINAHTRYCALHNRLLL